MTNVLDVANVFTESLFIYNSAVHFSVQLMYNKVKNYPNAFAATILYRIMHHNPLQSLLMNQTNSIS